MTPPRIVCAALLMAAAPFAMAQPPGDAAVGYVEARTYELRAEVRLPGTVESRLAATVAGEVAGKVLDVEVREGDRVKRGQVLVRLRPQAYRLLHAEAVARLEESQARVELASSRLKRMRELYDAEAVSQQDLDDAVSEDTAWRERETQNRAQIDQFELTLELLNVRAPFDGVVTRKLTDVGQWVVDGGAVVEMVSLSRLEVRVDVPERYFGTVRPGDAVGVTFQALPAVALAGKVARIVPSVSDQARTFPVLVSIDNENGVLGVGMLATVTLPVGGMQPVTIVPKDSIVRDGADEVVYRIGADGTAERVGVSSGAGAGEWIAVRGGIRPGDRIVVRGNERLEPGQAVQGTPRQYAEP